MSAVTKLLKQRLATDPSVRYAAADPNLDTQPCNPVMLPMDDNRDLCPVCGATMSIVDDDSIYSEMCHECDWHHWHRKGANNG